MLRKLCFAVCLLASPLLAEFTCNGVFDKDTEDYNCYPSVTNKPEASEELCLAQGCCWNVAAKVPCQFGKVDAPSAPVCAKVAPSSRLECRNPTSNVPIASETQCNAMGCCFDKKAQEPGIVDSTIKCYQPYAEGYQVLKMNKTNSGLEASLVLPTGARGPFGNDVKELKLLVWFEKEYRLRFKIVDPSFNRYEVKNIVNSEEPVEVPQESLYEFGYTSAPFGVSVTRKLTGQVLFNSTPDDTFGGMVYENQYLEISSQLSSTKDGKSLVYGLGEHAADLLLPKDGPIGQHYTFFARDQGAGWADHRTQGGYNLYGSHPFYMQLEDDGNSHGVFFLNSNAIEVVLQEHTITFRSVGGVLDFFVFLGPSPAQVVEQHTELVGRQMLPAYWTLGFHLSKWGITANESKILAEKMIEAEIPVDSQWNDIDYMDQYALYTLDPKSYSAKDMNAYVKVLHDHAKKYVNIHDPAVSTEFAGTFNYTAYRRAKELNILIKEKTGKAPLIGKVWPGWTAFPDYLHPNATEFWVGEVEKFHKVLPFDGMWIDMNEPSNFCDGQWPFACRNPPGAVQNPESPKVFPPHFKGDLTPEYIKSEDVQYPFDPFRQPYVPGQTAGNGNLDQGTVAMSGMQHDSLHYNLHNLFGHSELIQSNLAMTKVTGKRPFVLTRSTFPGSGKYGAHWLGDNKSSWGNLRDSITGIMAMNMFGITQVGADICGFLENTNPELCIRWSQLGAFYPFSRNHNSMMSSFQAPVDFDVVTTGLIRDSIVTRYELLPYFYTLFFESNTKGATILRPLFFEFPKDLNTSAIQEQFMLGDALLVSPVVYETHRTVEAYFPAVVWYDYWTGVRVTSGEKPETHTLEAPLGMVNVHVRGGSILVNQIAGQNAMTTKTNPQLLTVALDQTGSAKGRLYLDDGESLNTIESKNYTLLHFTASYSEETGITVSANAVVGNYHEKSQPLTTISVYGVPTWNDTLKVFVNGEQVSNVQFDKSTQRLFLKDLSINTSSGFQVTSGQHPPEAESPAPTSQSPIDDLMPGYTFAERFAVKAAVLAVLIFLIYMCVPCCRPRRQGYEQL